MLIKIMSTICGREKRIIITEKQPGNMNIKMKYKRKHRATTRQIIRKQNKENLKSKLRQIKKLIENMKSEE